ncbi:tetratricopeptide repeat protein [Candidatus Omnitrophota bacterium]
MKAADAIKVIIISVVLIGGGALNMNRAFAQKQSIYQLMKEAEGLYKAGNYDQVENRCKRVLEMDPDFFYAYNLLGSIYTQREGFEQEAIAFFTKSLEINDGQVEIYNYVGSLHNRIGNADEAIVFFEEGLERDPDYFYLNFNLGLLYLIQKKDPYKAAEFLGKAQAQRPDYDRVLYLSGLTHSLIGEEYAALESVTMLREIKNEFLAAKLEEIIRKYRQGEGVDVTKALKDYSNQPKKPAPAVQQDNAVQLGEPTTKAQGTGTLTIKTQMGSGESGDTPPAGTVRQSGTGTVSTRMRVGGTGKVRVQGTAQPIFE